MTAKDTLSEARTVELIQTYGADLGNWPAQLAEAAAPIIEAPSPAIASALSEEAELDALLMTVPEVEAPRRLYEAVMAGAPKPSQAGQVSKLGWSLSGWGARLTAAASALAMGLTIGLGTAAASAPSDDPFSDATYFAFDLEGFVDNLEEGSQ